MKTKNIVIGNSKGIIIPKKSLTQCGIENELSIEVKDHQIIITATAPILKRKGWAKAFKEMAENGDGAF